MSVTVYWVRHGPTHQKVMTGWRDVPADLSDADRLNRLSAYLPAAAPLVSSDLIRAVDTAEALRLRSPLRQQLAPHVGLREFHFGDWEGLHFTEIDEAASRRFWDEPGDHAPPNGESWNDVSRRVSSATDEILENVGPVLILVAHMGAIMTQIARCGVPAGQVYGLEIAPLSVTVLTRSSGEWTLGAVNHQP